MVGQQRDQDEGRRPHAVVPRAQAVGDPGDEADEHPCQHVADEREDDRGRVDLDAAREHHDGLVHGRGDCAEQGGSDVEGTDDAYEGIPAHCDFHRRGGPGLVVGIARQEGTHAARAHRDEREEQDREEDHDGKGEQANGLAVHRLRGLDVNDRQGKGGDHAQADTGPHGNRARLLTAATTPGGGHEADDGAEREHRQQQRQGCFTHLLKHWLSSRNKGSPKS